MLGDLGGRHDVHDQDRREALLTPRHVNTQGDGTGGENRTPVFGFGDRGPATGPHR